MRRLKITLSDLVIYSFIALYSLAAIAVSLNRFWQYNVFWYDFGIFDETVWRLSRFQLPNIPSLNPPLGLINWGDHLNLSTVLLAPLYWLTDRQEVILMAQVLFVAAGAVIAYSLAKKFFSSFFVKVALIISFLGYVGMQNALITDVHSIVFAVPFIMLVFWAIHAKHWKIYWLALLVTLGWQESLSAVVVGVGAYLILHQPRDIKKGAMTIAAGIIYALFATKVIIPFFGGHRYSYEPYLPAQPQDWIVTLFNSGTKIQTLFYTFLSFGFLPIFSTATLPLIVEHFVERFVLNLTGTRWSLGFHYNSILSPILFIATVDTLRAKFFRRWTNLIPIWAAATILIVVFLHRFTLRGPLALSYNPAFYEGTTDAKFMNDFVSQIPKGNFLMTQNNIAAHFTHQKVSLLVQDFTKVNPDTIAIDLRPGQNLNNFYPLKDSETKALVSSLLAPDSKYKKVGYNDYQFIFIRK